MRTAHAASRLERYRPAMVEEVHLQVERFRSLNREVREYLKENPIRNAFVYHDLSDEPGRSQLWLARRDGVPAAHLLVYDSSEFGATWAHMAGDRAVASALVPHIPDHRVVVIAQPNMVGAITRRLRGARVILEDIMDVERGSERLLDSTQAVRVGPDHAEAYVRLVVPAIVPRSVALLERNRKHLKEEVVYGVLQDETLVAVAGTSVRTPDAWIVGGVETLPDHRRRGFARATTSAVIREALRVVDRVGLWVASDNRPAIALYASLGFRKLAGSAWIDLGTGLKP